MPSFKPVIALSRGLEVLRVVNEERESSVGSLHRATGLDKATIVRMLETLEHEGYVLRDADRALYAPTGRAVLLSQGYDQHLWVGSLAEPVMRAFRRDVGWPSDIGVFDRDAMVVAQTTREPGVMGFSRRPGFRFPVLMTSLGRAYLAFCDGPARDRIIAALAAVPGPSTDLARHPRILSKLIAETRERGYAVMDDRYSREVFDNKVWALGVPVRNEHQVFASINLTILRSAVPPEEGIKQFLKPLQAAATSIAAILTDKTRGKVHDPAG
jgi:IclR family transcriptional regulator, mhp operon transcriptional activator